MESQIQQNKISQLARQRNGLLFFSILLTCAVLLLSALLFCKKERTIIIPTSGPTYWIEDQRVSSAYLEKMGLFLSDLLLNRSAVDVEKRNQIILQYVHPTSYPDFKRQLMQEQEEILKNGQAYFFRVQNSGVDLNRSAFVVRGESDVWIEKQGKDSFVAHAQEKQYTLQFRCENGKLMLESLKKELV